MPSAVPMLRVQNEFEIDGGRWVIASLSMHGTPAEIFGALLDGYRQWCTAKKSEHSKFDVIISASARDPAHEVLLRNLVYLWNSTKKPRCPGKVEVWISSHEQFLYGFTNATFPDEATKRTQTVRYVTYEEMDEALSAATNAMQEEERERRRASPVCNPIRLPKNIANELARYLRLEFAELEFSRVSGRELRYVGEVTIDGVPTQFWSVETEVGEAIWGVVERFDDYYVLSSTGLLPKELGANAG